MSSQGLASDGSALEWTNTARTSCCCLTPSSKAARAPWLDGRSTAGASAAPQKRNQQVDETTDDGRAIGARVMKALQRSAVFAAAAFPSRVSQPMMNRYAPGMEYGPHVDNSLMGGNEPLRTDMFGTLVLSA